MNRASRLCGVVFMAGLFVVAQARAATWIELQPTGATPPVDVSPGAVFYDAPSNRLIASYPGNPSLHAHGNEVWILTNANGLGATAPEWIKLLPTGTPPISNGQESVVYDAAQNRLIVYGGCYANCSPALSDVFILTNANGSGGIPEWIRPSVTNPQPRVAHSAVYDAASNRMITFAGGLAFFGLDKNDTRVLSNANGLLRTPTWTQMTPAGGPPAVRGYHSAVYDAANDRMIVFGGLQWQQTSQTSVPLGDLWELRNATGAGGTPEWVELAQSGQVPGPRYEHGAAWDAANQRMIVLGGGDQDFQVANRVWVLSLDGNGPGNQPPVANAGAAQQVRRGSMVQLNGQGSYDPEGEAITPTWQFLSVPAGSGAALVGADTLTPTFVADADGVYRVRLDVVDPLGAMASAMVTITASGNRPPVAVIAPVPAITRAPAERRLDGTGSFDPDGDRIVMYRWRLVSRPAASTRAALSGTQYAEPVLFMDVTGSYVVELAVWDQREVRGVTTATVTVTGCVGDCPPPPEPPQPTACDLDNFLQPCRFVADPFDGTPYWYQCASTEITQRATARPGDPFGSSVGAWRVEGGTATWAYDDSIGGSDSGAYYAGTIRQGCNLGRWQLTQTGAVSHFNVVKGYSVWVLGTTAGFEVYARCVRAPSYRATVIGRSLSSDEFVNQIVLDADRRWVTVNSTSFTRGARTQFIPLAFTCPLP